MENVNLVSFIKSATQHNNFSYRDIMLGPIELFSLTFCAEDLFTFNEHCFTDKSIYEFSHFNNKYGQVIEADTVVKTSHEDAVKFASSFMLSFFKDYSRHSIDSMLKKLCEECPFNYMSCTEDYFIQDSDNCVRIFLKNNAICITFRPDYTVMIEEPFAQKIVTTLSEAKAYLRLRILIDKEIGKSIAFCASTGGALFALTHEINAGNEQDIIDHIVSEENKVKAKAEIYNFIVKEQINNSEELMEVINSINANCKDCSIKSLSLKEQTWKDLYPNLFIRKYALTIFSILNALNIDLEYNYEIPPIVKLFMFKKFDGKTYFPVPSNKAVLDISIVPSVIVDETFSDLGYM